MKKLFLLLAGGCMSLSVSAQTHTNVGSASGTIEAPQAITVMSNGKKITPADLRNSANKTTTGPTERWYNYSDYLDTSSAGRVALSLPYMWNDTSSQDIYSGPTLAHNRTVSEALFLDPYFSGFYDALYYDPAVEMQMTPAKPYTVDSLTIYGAFGFNPSKIAVVDTITIGYTWGTGIPESNTEDVWRNDFNISFAPASLLANYGLASTDSLWYKQVFYDSTINSIGGTHEGRQVITISSTAANTNTSANWADTTANGTFMKKIALTTPMNVPAGSIVAFTLSFKSGDASFVFGDTVFTGNPALLYKYNMFRPWVLYYTDATGSTTPAFAPYIPGMGNQGSFKTLPNFANGWKFQYVPMYAWTSSGGASTLQYPYMDIHVKCPTCATVSTPQVTGAQSINAFPNPTADQVNVTFTSTKAGNTTITLTNMLGQTVASQNLGNVTGGTATFSTATLPNGVYIYSAMQNGTRTTGRIVIAH